MKTDNELIAEFMGWRVAEGENGSDGTAGIYTKGQYYNDNAEHLPKGVVLKYDASWDWLMPVVEKIISLEYEPKDPSDSYNWNIPYIRTLGNNMCRFNRMAPHHGNSLMDSVYQGVVEFIKWYNDAKNH